MKITVEFLSLPVVTRIVGGKSISLNFSGQTIEDLLSEITNRYGLEMRRFLFDESGNLDRIFKILLNKKEWISRDQMNKILKDGDQVTIMMLVGGG
jgi:molybdopterin converting factor small subunit